MTIFCTLIELKDMHYASYREKKRNFWKAKVRELTPPFLKNYHRDVSIKCLALPQRLLSIRSSSALIPSWPESSPMRRSSWSSPVLANGHCAKLSQFWARQRKDNVFVKHDDGETAALKASLWGNKGARLGSFNSPFFISVLLNFFNHHEGRERRRGSSASSRVQTSSTRSFV